MLQRICVEILIVHCEAGWDLQHILDGLNRYTHKINKQTRISHEENFLEINSEQTLANARVESESERNRLTLAEP